MWAAAFCAAGTERERDACVLLLKKELGHAVASSFREEEDSLSRPDSPVHRWNEGVVAGSGTTSRMSCGSLSLLGQHRVLPVEIFNKKKRERNEKRAGRLVGYSYTPLYGKKQQGTKGAITIFELYLCREKIIIFHLTKKEQTDILFFLLYLHPSSTSCLSLSLLSLSDSWAIWFRLVSFSVCPRLLFIFLSLWSPIYSSRLFFISMREKQNGILDLSVGTIAYSASFSKAVGGKISDSASRREREFLKKPLLSISDSSESAERRRRRTKTEIGPTVSLCSCFCWWGWNDRQGRRKLSVARFTMIRLA